MNIRVVCAGCTMEYPATQPACHNCGYASPLAQDTQSLKYVPEYDANGDGETTEINEPEPDETEQSIMLILHTVLGEDFLHPVSKAILSMPVDADILDAVSIDQ